MDGRKRCADEVGVVKIKLLHLADSPYTTGAVPELSYHSRALHVNKVVGNIVATKARHICQLLHYGLERYTKTP